MVRLSDTILSQLCFLKRSLSICFFIVILLAGGIIYFLNLRRIYNYKYNQSDDVNNEKNIKFSFSKLPLGLKAFHILCYILLSVSFIIIVDSFINGFEPLKNLVVHISVILSSVCNIISRKHRWTITIEVKFKSFLMFIVSIQCLLIRATVA